MGTADGIIDFEGGQLISPLRLLLLLSAHTLVYSLLFM